MSDDSDSKPYLYSALEGRDEGAAACGSMAQLHRLGGYGEGRGRGGAELGLPSEGSDSSSQDPGPSSHGDRKRSRSLHEEDVEMKSSGSSGSGTESHSNESHGNESNGNESHGNESLRSSNGNSKDSALLESSGSNKRSVPLHHGEWLAASSVVLSIRVLICNTGICNGRAIITHYNTVLESHAFSPPKSTPITSVEC